jgi:hypothetical protein
MQLLEACPCTSQVKILERPWKCAQVADERSDVRKLHRHAIFAKVLYSPASGLQLADSDIGRPCAVVNGQAEQGANRGSLITTDLLGQERSARLDDPANVKGIKSFVPVQHNIEGCGLKGEARSTPLILLRHIVDTAESDDQIYAERP